MQGVWCRLQVKRSDCFLRELGLYRIAYFLLVLDGYCVGRAIFGGSAAEEGKRSFRKGFGGWF